MSLSEQTLTAAIQTVVDPHTGRDFVASKQLKNLRVAGADVSFQVELGYPAKSLVPALKAALEAAVRTVPGVGAVSVDVVSRVVPHAVQRGVQLLPNVKNIIAVA